MQATRNHPLCPFLLLQVLLKAKTHAKVKHVCASMSIYGVRSGVLPLPVQDPPLPIHLW